MIKKLVPKTTRLLTQELVFIVTEEERLSFLWPTILYAVLNHRETTFGLETGFQFLGFDFEKLFSSVVSEIRE